VYSAKNVVQIRMGVYVFKKEYYRVQTNHFPSANNAQMKTG
jgi:hypothetical protein